MIQRDTIQEIEKIYEPDGQGGRYPVSSTTSIITCHLSFTDSSATMTQFGVSADRDRMLYVVSSVPLKDSEDVRYRIDGRNYKIRSMIAGRRDYYSTLVETK